MFPRMAKSLREIDDLRERLGALLANWGSEIAAVMQTLEDQQSLAATHDDSVQALEKQVAELARLRQRIRERDLALDHLTTKSKERDARIAELEGLLKKARARIDELERQAAAPEKPAEPQPAAQHEEFEAMRAELAARKSLVKSLRTDAERGKALEKELARTRDEMAAMKTSSQRHARTIAELRRSSDDWERKYRELAETAGKRLSRETDRVPRDMRIEPTVDAPTEVDGTRTVVIDMTESLRAARDERRRKTDR